MSTFSVGADAYDRFMGRFSVPLSVPFADAAGLGDAEAVLDVGCGPGALTAELLRRGLRVTAVDPQEGFAAAARERNPAAEVLVAPAERLPFEDGTFDAALAQLVVQFMDDPVAGLREMARVTRPGGVVAACLWDHGTGRGPLSPFWRAAGTAGEASQAGVRPGELERLFTAAGLREVAAGEIAVEVEHATFEAWWEPYTLGVGPAGAYLRKLPPAERDGLRDRCRAELPDPPFTQRAVAWTARGLA